MANRRALAEQHHWVLFLFKGKSGVWFLSAILFSLAAWKGKREDFDSSPPPAQSTCQLLKIFDGDTILARCHNSRYVIRLLGIDAPEKDQRPWGQRATAALSQILPQHFTLKSQGRGFYHRVLGTLYNGQKNINFVMVRQGMAVAYRGPDTDPKYYQAEREAKNENLGIWSEPGLQQNPKRWRQYHH